MFLVGMTALVTLQGESLGLISIALQLWQALATVDWMILAITQTVSSAPWNIKTLKMYQGVQHNMI
jgi:hypothetical protein